ncbi:hypothetical protein DBB33_07560 [Chromobacterium haemolyticum]|nr:hypothetical protein B0T40_23745 [Chromobacterium haemolyticum]PTU69300.1 hypothetical protein DBB33_07560 [Chromobacterium haemolyticum]
MDVIQWRHTVSGRFDRRARGFHARFRRKGKAATLMRASWLEKLLILNVSARVARKQYLGIG